MSSQEGTPDVPDGFGDIVARFIHHIPVEERLAGLTTRERLAGIPTEQRFADLSPDSAVLANAYEVLRALNDDFLATLSPETREAVRRRIGR